MELKTIVANYKSKVYIHKRYMKLNINELEYKSYKI